MAKKKVKTIEGKYLEVYGEDFKKYIPYAFKFGSETEQHKFHYAVMSDRYEAYDGIGNSCIILFKDTEYLEKCIEICKGLGGEDYKPNLKLPRIEEE